MYTVSDIKFILNNRNFFLISGDAPRHPGKLSGTDVLKTIIEDVLNGTVIEVEGTYGGQTECSLLVVGITGDRIEKLANLFGQESFIAAYPDTQNYYLFFTGPDAHPNPIMAYNLRFLADEEPDNYTKVITVDGSLKFSIDF